MKRLPVQIVPNVEQRIVAQALYIARDSIDNALAWEERLRRYIHSIGRMHGHAVDEVASAELGCTIRKAVFEDTYLIHYYVDPAGGSVRIVGFRHGAGLPRKGEP